MTLELEILKKKRKREARTPLKLILLLTESRIRLWKMSIH